MRANPSRWDRQQDAHKSEPMIASSWRHCGSSTAGCIRQLVSNSTAGRHTDFSTSKSDQKQEKAAVREWFMSVNRHVCQIGYANGLEM